MDKNSTTLRDQLRASSVDIFRGAMSFDRCFKMEAVFYITKDEDDAKTLVVKVDDVWPTRATVKSEPDVPNVKLESTQEPQEQVGKPETALADVPNVKPEPTEEEPKEQVGEPETALTLDSPQQKVDKPAEAEEQLNETEIVLTLALPKQKVFPAGTSESDPVASKLTCDVDVGKLPRCSVVIERIDKDVFVENVDDEEEGENEVIDASIILPFSTQRQPSASCSTHESRIVSHPGPPLILVLPFKCDHCNSSFASREALVKHMPSHIGVYKPHFCKYCGNGFAFLGTLTKHLRIHAQKHYKCPFCFKAFTQMDRHLRIHTGEKPFECGICLKAFARPDTLKVHERLHTGQKPYKCRICYKRFASTATRWYHERTHSGTKPYICQTCQKPFIKRGNLTQHVLTHSKEKPFTCGTCDKAFARKTDIKRHEQAHKGEKPFKDFIL